MSIHHLALVQLQHLLDFFFDAILHKKKKSLQTRQVYFLEKKKLVYCERYCKLLK